MSTTPSPNAKKPSHLKQATYLPSLNIHVHVQISRCCRQSGNGLNVSSESIQIPSTNGKSNVTHWYGETRWRTLQRRVVAERILRFRDAYGQIPKPLLRVSVDFLLRGLAEGHRRGTVHVLADLLDTLLHAAVQVI